MKRGKTHLANRVTKRGGEIASGHGVTRRKKENTALEKEADKKRGKTACNEAYKTRGENS